MKKLFFLLPCLLIIGLFTMCTETELDVTESVKGDEITTDVIIPGDGSESVGFRDDCSDCAVDDCCCTIELLSGGTADVDICGTSDGVDACGPITVGNCSTVNGGLQNFSLPVLKPTFCVPENGAFSVTNTENYGITVRISCQNYYTNPQWDTITLAARSRAVRETDGDCVVFDCQ